MNLKEIKDKLPVSLYVGTKDYLLAGSQSLHQLMADLKVEHTYREFEGVTHNLAQYSSQTKETPFDFASRNFK